jgi:hypothetical protein
LILTNTIKRDNSVILETGKGFRLIQEADLVRWVIEQMWFDELDSHQLLQVDLASFPYLAHASSLDLAEQLVVAECHPVAEVNCPCSRPHVTLCAKSSHFRSRFLATNVLNAGFYKPAITRMLPENILVAPDCQIEL